MYQNPICFHLHLLIYAGEDGTDLIKFITEFKQKTGYRFKKKYGANLWQKSFFDHVLRKDESVVDIARYMFNNPVRKGLVKEFKKYPYLRSMIIGIDELYL